MKAARFVVVIVGAVVLAWSVVAPAVADAGRSASFVAIQAMPRARSYWAVTANGQVFQGFGMPSPLGDPASGGVVLAAPLVSIAATPSGSGYWLAGAAVRLAAPIVGIAATPSGRGYWLLGADGGVFTFGDAPYLGSAATTHLSTKFAAITPTPTGRGYTLV